MRYKARRMNKEVKNRREYLTKKEELKYMNDGGKILLKVISVIFIIFGAIATVVSLIALITSTWLGVIWVIASIILLISSIIELVIGFVGLKKSDDPSQANFFIVSGLVLVILMFVSMIMSFSAWNLIGFALPVLYIVGGYMMRNAQSRKA